LRREKDFGNEKFYMKAIKSIFKLILRIRGVVAHDPFVNDPFRMLSYIYEELGECSEVLIHSGGSKGYKTGPNESLEDELVDVIIATLGNYFAAGGTIEHLMAQMDKKITKWETNLN
jgi:NTP pyrophosphatase (non-canonical NTP hydrolase)